MYNLVVGREVDRIQHPTECTAPRRGGRIRNWARTHPLIEREVDRCRDLEPLWTLRHVYKVVPQSAKLAPEVGRNIYSIEFANLVQNVMTDLAGLELTLAVEM
jgi:hypothetical protein